MSTSDRGGVNRHATRCVVPTSVVSQWIRVEVCMGMGIPTGMGFPWESHGNGSSFWATNGNGNNVVGMGMAHTLKVLFSTATCSDR